jgi:hypothetical protein
VALDDNLECILRDGCAPENKLLGNKFLLDLPRVHFTTRAGSTAATPAIKRFLPHPV